MMGSAITFLYPTNCTKENMKHKIIECPSCGAEARTSGTVSCLCDKDNCIGQRCGANDIAENFNCPQCKESGITPEAKKYIEYHANH